MNNTVFLSRQIKHLNFNLNNDIMFNMSKLNTIFCLATMALILATGCTGRVETVKTERVIPVKILVVNGSATTTDRNYVGTAEESFAISLSFALTGTVELVAVSEGQRVGKGQLLAALNSGTAKNAYDVAQSTLRQAQDAYDRIKSLHEKGSVTDLQFVEVETGLEKARAMEAISRKNLEDTKLYAPFAGMIAKRSVEEGANVMPGVSLFKLVSIDEIDVKVPIPENEIGDVRTGQAAMITVPALGNREYRGVVHHKGVEANPVSRTYNVQIRLKNPQSELMPGMVCKAFLTQNDTEQRIVIPNKSVQIAPDGKRFVWLCEENIAKRRFVTTGTLTDFGVTVESGLADGDRLITEGYNKVSEGMKVSFN